MLLFMSIQCWTSLPTKGVSDKRYNYIVYIKLFISLVRVVCIPDSDQLYIVHQCDIILVTFLQDITITKRRLRNKPNNLEDFKKNTYTIGDWLSLRIQEPDSVYFALRNNIIQMIKYMYFPGRGQKRRVVPVKNEGTIAQNLNVRVDKKKINKPFCLGFIITGYSE